MKNIIHTLPARTAKLRLLSEKRKNSKNSKKSDESEAITVDNFRSFYDKVGSERNIYDCNSNQIVHQSPSFPKLRRAKTWTKDISTKLQDLSLEIKNKSFSIADKDTEYFGQHLANIQEAVEQVTRRSSRRIKKHIRSVSDNITTFTKAKTVDEIIDYGKCYSPTELNYRILMERFSTKKRNLSVYMRSKSLTESIKEPAKRIMSSSTLLRKVSRYESQTSEDNTGSNETINRMESLDEDKVIDVSRSREKIHVERNYKQDISLSTNVWYYGELKMQFVTIDNESSDFVTSVLVRIDEYGNVLYSLTYQNGGDLCIGIFPHDGKRYCLDFLDPNQPRFASVKYLLAYLIEQKVLQRVSFLWLVDNCT